MLPMPNLWTNMCVENWAVVPLSHASTLTTIRHPSCRRPSPTTAVAVAAVRAAVVVVVGSDDDWQCALSCTVFFARISA